MAKAVVLRDVLVFRHRQDTRCRHYPPVLDDECTVVQRRVLEEDVLHQPRGDSRIQALPRVGVFAQALLAGNHYQCPRLRLRQVPTGQHQLLHILVGCRLIRMQPSEAPVAEARTQLIEERPYLLLKYHDDGYRSHAYHPLEYSPCQVQLNNKGNQEPHQQKRQHPPEQVHRTRLPQ